MQKTIYHSAIAYVAIKMGRMNLAIHDDIERKLREQVFRRKGMKKGNLTEAVEEAIVLWINTNEKTSRSKKNGD